MSRELDALVAEALGWSWEGTMLVPPIGDERRLWAAEWDREGRPSYLPFHSTRIAAALPLFEWLAAHGIVRLSNGDGDSMDCDFVPKWPFAIDKLKSAHVTADTWCKAICYAFLEANGIECI